MKRGATFILAAGLVLAMAPGALALGTTAGTRIINEARAEYTVGSSPTITAYSGTEAFTVAELVDVAVTWADASTVSVLGPLPATGVPLRFTVTNLGNGDEDWDLTVDSTLGGDDFDPDITGTSPLIYRDNGDSLFNTATDTLVVGSEAIQADSLIDFWVVNDFSDTSPTGPGDGDLALVSLTATSTSAASGSVQTGAGDGGGDLVLSAAGGTGSDTGAYQVVLTVLNMVKSYAIADTVSPTGDQPIPGAVITYTIEIAVQGAGTAQGVVVTDPIPADTTYVPGTLRLNGAPAGTVSGTPPEAVINVGDLDAAAGTQTITFDVTID